MDSNTLLNHPIIFFDQNCYLCNQWIRFILKYDTQKMIYFAPLQSSFAKKILPSKLTDVHTIRSVVLYHKRKYWTKSTAVLHILNILGGLFSIGSVFLIIIPCGINDYIYDIVAKHRYLFNKNTAACKISISDFTQHEHRFYFT